MGRGGGLFFSLHSNLFPLCLASFILFVSLVISGRTLLSLAASLWPFTMTGNTAKRASTVPAGRGVNRKISTRDWEIIQECVFSSLLTYNNSPPPRQAEIYVHELQQVLDQTHWCVASQAQLCQTLFCSSNLKNLSSGGCSIDHLLNEWLR